VGGTWQVIFGAIGAVSGVVALFAWFLGAGRKIGQLEHKIESLESKLIDQTSWGALVNKVDTMYDIYVMEVLRRGGGPGTKHDANNPGKPR